MSLLRNCCSNWKVWTGAGALLLVVLVVDPKALGAVLPVALGLACPLSMGAMMWGMRPSHTSATLAPRPSRDTEARIAALQAEIAELRATPQQFGAGEGEPELATTASRTAAVNVSPLPNQVRSRPWPDRGRNRRLRSGTPLGH
jgi:hypothetical protein